MRVPRSCSRQLHSRMCRRQQHGRVYPEPGQPVLAVAVPRLCWRRRAQDHVPVRVSDPAHQPVLAGGVLPACLCCGAQKRCKLHWAARSDEQCIHWWRTTSASVLRAVRENTLESSGSARSNEQRAGHRRAVLRCAV